MEGEIGFDYADDFEIVSLMSSEIIIISIAEAQNTSQNTISHLNKSES